ncbi:hypothetical protein ERAQ111492_00495 [Erysipelothrix aquatica]
MVTILLINQLGKNISLAYKLKESGFSFKVAYSAFEAIEQLSRTKSMIVISNLLVYMSTK